MHFSRLPALTDATSLVLRQEGTKPPLFLFYFSAFISDNTSRKSLKAHIIELSYICDDNIILKT